MPHLFSHHHDARFLASSSIDTIRLSPNRKQLFVHSREYPNHTFELFDAETGKLTSSYNPFYKDYSFEVLENTERNELFYWSSDGEYKTDGKTYHLYRINTENDTITVEKTEVQFSTKGYYPYIVFRADCIYIGTAAELLVLDAVNFETKKRIKSPYQDDNDSNGVHISPDGKFVLFADWHTQQIAVIAIETEAIVHTLAPEKMRDDFGPHFLSTHNDHEIIIGGKECVTVWNITTGKCLLKIKTDGIYNSSLMDMQLSPNGNYLALIHTGRVLSCYDMATGEQFWRKSNVDGLNCCCFAPDSGSLFISIDKGMQKVMVKSGEFIAISNNLSNLNIEKLYVLPIENQLLAFLNMQAVHLNATTGVIEKELFASNWAKFAYNPHETDSPKNFLAGDHYGIRVGNALDGKVKQVITSHRGSDLAISDSYVGCHNYRSSIQNIQLKVYDLNGQNECILANTKKNMPTEGLEFLGESPLLAGVGEGFVAVWNAETKTEVWRTPLKTGLNYGKLHTHETGSHLFVLKKKCILTCLDATDGTILWQYEPRKEKPAIKNDKSAKTIEFRSVFGRNNQVICLMQNGDLRALDIATGKVLHREKAHEKGSICAALAPDNSIYIINEDTSVSRFDLQDWLGKGNELNFALDATTTPSEKTFEIPDKNTATSDLMAHFAAIDWASFTWERDAEPLIDLLNYKEKTEKTSDLHYLCSERLLALNKDLRTKFFKLTHRYGHFTDMVAFGASPDGHYFATGSWVGDDYDAGGELMIWDVKTGRCVNKMHSVEGGVGWPDYSGCIKWSPDGSKFALVVNTNGLAVIDPFTDTYSEDAVFYETDGWSRPMQWCWQPEAKALFLACWTDSCKVPGCVAPLARNTFPLSKPYSFNQAFAANLFTKKEIEKSDNHYDEEATSPLTNYNKMGWSSKGFLFGKDNAYAYTLNPQTRSLGTVIKQVNSASAWSPDGDYLLRVREKDIEVFTNEGAQLQTIHVGNDLIGNALKNKKSKSSDSMLEVSIGDNGVPTLLFGRTPIKDIERIYWHQNPKECLFAAAVLGKFGYLAFYRNFELVGIVNTNIIDIGSWSLGDALPFTFSPDGSRAVSLSNGGKVTIWDLENTKNGVQISTEFAVNSSAEGVFYPSSDRIITIHESAIYFYDTEKGTAINHYTTVIETDKPDLAFSPLGALGNHFNFNPYFPIAHQEQTHWIAAFETGLVICEKELVPRLNTELCFTLGNRYTWSYHWAKPHIATDLQTALQTAADDIPLPKKAKKTLLESFTAKPVKNPADYFLTVTKSELFGKNTKKGGIQFDDNSRDFYKNTKKTMQIDAVTLALKAAKEYHAPAILKSNAITAESLRALVGKVVLYKESYAPTQVRIGTVLGVTADTLSLFNIEFKNGKQNGSGSSNMDFDSVVSIGLAEIRA